MIDSRIGSIKGHLKDYKIKVLVIGFQLQSGAAVVQKFTQTERNLLQHQLIRVDLVQVERFWNSRRVRDGGQRSQQAACKETEDSDWSFHGPLLEYP